MGLFKSRRGQLSDDGCPCGGGPVELDHLDTHVVEVTTTTGVPALTYNCPVCGVGSDLWRRDEEGRAGAPAGLFVHLMEAHHIGR
jgi:hypothetical protein